MIARPQCRTVRLKLIFPALRRQLCFISVVGFGALLLVACSGSDDVSETSTVPDENTDSEEIAVGAFDPDLIADEGLSEDITIVDCTLSGGTVTTCYQVKTNGSAAGVTVGPFCPENISVQDEEDVGVWVDGGSEVYDITGDFIVNLPNLYGDQNWALYDIATGDVNVTSECAAPVGEATAEQQNQCIECLLEDVDGGIAQTILIPTTPVPIDASVEFPDNGFTMGVALNAVPLSGPAGVDVILGAYQIAAFDDCGGHINNAEGYHYHGATDCNATGIQEDGHAAMIGYTIDGYGLYARVDSDGNEPAALDECRGETDDTRGYHYHAGALSTNRIIDCFHGETAGDLGAGG